MALAATLKGGPDLPDGLRLPRRRVRARASAPLGRRDGSEKDLRWSLDLYRDAGVPPERTILGLPLYGLVWPVEGPEIGAAATGRGDVWVPRRNLETLALPDASPSYDDVEDVEVLAVPNGDAGRPSTTTRRRA